MSKIAVRVEDITDKTAVLSKLRHITGLGLGDLNQRLYAPVALVEYELFNNDHEEVAARLDQLMTEIPPTGATLRLYELPPEATFETYDNVATHEITVEILRNILQEAERLDEEDIGL